MPGLRLGIAVVAQGQDAVEAVQLILGLGVLPGQKRGVPRKHRLKTVRQLWLAWALTRHI